MFTELSTALLAEGYGVRFRAGGNSMHPTIVDGEIVRVEPVSAREIKRGDIILYRAGRGLTAHRVVVVGVNGNETAVFQMRGDACATFDEPVTGEQIMGRVIEVERDGRTISLIGRAAGFRRNARRLAHRLKAASGRVIGTNFVFARFALFSRGLLRVRAWHL
ncbi:MAG TPA: S24 family peptidase [Pyrinomonadaceae bacterium]|nr:S24 family peptidase [Pyrinomonadaceae bacterium]